MRLNVWPACISCPFIKIEEIVEEYSIESFDEGQFNVIRENVLECIHEPVCSRIRGQLKIEGSNK